MRTWAISSVAVAALFAGLADARAWEGETTHAGLAERAALGSSLRAELVERFDLELGLFAPLAIPPAEAPALYEALAELNPTHGYAPDEAGELTALGWLVAGAAIADIPPRHAIHHAYDPLRQAGFSSTSISGLALGHRLRARAAGAQLRTEGMPATEWLVHPDNPYSLASFLEQYAQAVTAPTPDARGRHAAAMLLAAGAIIHVVQDTASPERARDDRAAMLRQVGRDRTDVGSRLERLASLSFGRLGVPAPSRELPLRPALADYITSDRGDGLADRVARGLMSANTVPRPIEATPETTSTELARRLRDHLRRPEPAPEAPLDLRAAASDEGARLVGATGVCIAHYELKDRELSWHIPDDCALDQLRVVLAEASAYGAGVLDWLFRGEIDVRVRGNAVEVAPQGQRVRDARVVLLWEDERGVRTPFASIDGVSGGPGDVIARAALPDGGARRIVALFRGVDEHGEPLAASGAADL